MCTENRSWRSVFFLAIVGFTIEVAGQSVVLSQPRDADEVLSQFLRVEQIARSGGNTSSLDVDPLVSLIASALQPGVDPSSIMPTFSDVFEKLQIMGGQDPELAMRNLGSYSSAVASMLHYICHGEADCNRLAYGVLATNKGALAEVISKRPRSFLNGANEVANSAKQALARDEVRLTFVDQMLAAQFGKDILDFPPDKRTAEILRRQAGLTQEESLAGVERSMRLMTETPEGRQFATAITGFLTSPELASGQVAQLDFLQQLKEGEVWVDFFRYKPRTNSGFGEFHYLAMVSKNQEDGRTLDVLTAAPVESAIEALFTAVNSGRPSDGAWTKLMDAVWKPLRAALPAGTKRVFISPDALLSLVPWAGLANSDLDAPLVTVMQSGYQLSRERASNSPESNRTLIVGGLDFGAEGAFRPLPGSSDEIAYLDGMSKAKQLPTTVLRGTAATRSEVMAAMNTASLVHLATHGFMSDSGRLTEGMTGFQLDKAGVALSAANSDRSGQGLLTARDVSGMDLRKCDLVVISACVSGSGRPSDGQGVLGFQTAFTAAGVRSMLVSLWKVPDEPTALLMQEFYRAYWQQGMSKAQALRNAQEKVRKEFAPVQNWAAWQLIGEAF